MTMSTKAYDEALDFMPGAASRRGGGLGEKVFAVLQAFADGRRAQDDFKRLVARGIEPSEAVKQAFSIPSK
jgi:hypothetical protein